MVGRSISHYHILESLGAGGMGVVYKAQDTRLNRVVAIKFLPEETAESPEALQRFRREAQAASALNHPNICTIYELGDDGGTPFIVMELLEGQTLKAKMGGKALPLSEVIRWGAQICDGLAAAHSRGIVHRDIKPANIFINQHGFAKILDFGLAKLHPAGAATNLSAMPTASDEAQLTRAGESVGTVAYMSPEQVRAEELDARSDLFSFGSVLYEMATGSAPFRGESLGVIYDAILNRAPTPAIRLNPDVTPQLEAVIDRALEKDRKLRYQSAPDAAADLRRVERDASGGSVTTGASRGDVAARGTSRAKWVAGATAAALLAGVAVLGWWFRERTAHATMLTDKDTIVLSNFANTTGDPVFDGTLRQGLSVQLEQSPFLSIVPDRQMAATLKLMGKPVDADLTADTAREICQRAGSAAVLEGTIAQLGSKYLLTLRAKNCESDATLASAEAQAEDKAAVLDALGKMATDIRGKLGESLGSVHEHATPLEQATTSSLEALKAYSTARDVHTHSGDADAIPFYLHALELDPNFAIANAWLGIAYGSVGGVREQQAYVTKAFNLRDRTSESERLMIEATYYKEVTGNIPKSIAACDLWIKAYPRNEFPHVYLAGAVLPMVGEYERGARDARRAIEMNPAIPVVYAFLMFHEMAQGKLDAAADVSKLADQRSMSHMLLQVIRYNLAFVRNDRAALDAIVAGSRSHEALDEAIDALEADSKAYYGRLNDARELTQKAVEAAQPGHRKDEIATFYASAALREALYGNAADARKFAKLASADAQSRDVQFSVAMANAIVGDVGAAGSTADALAKSLPDDTLLSGNLMPALRAQIAIAKGHADQAVQELKAAEQCEKCQSTAGTYIWTVYYPPFVRGQAYLAAHQPEKAAVEFQKLLDNPWLVINEPIGPLARIGLARAHAMAGDKEKAKQAYEDFFKLWENADPNVPVAVAAKAEYAKLN